MHLRRLNLADAPLMLQWMHDETVVAHMGANFAAKTLTDCEHFITASLTDEENLHLAVADESGEYMGTVSLKHIDRTRLTAEFAITVRSAAMGRGFSRFGMAAILEKGIHEMGLREIYWCVSPYNLRAVRFYDKSGYRHTTRVPTHVLTPYSEQQELVWYVYTGE